MANSVHDLFQVLLFEWLDGNGLPDVALEGAVPEVACALLPAGSTPEEWTFDSLVHNEVAPGWECRAVEFAEVFDGPFYFYEPGEWSEVLRRDERATIGPPGRARQSIVVLHRSRWRPLAARFLELARVGAFAFYPTRPPHYGAWVFATLPDATVPPWAWAAYVAGDWAVVVRGDAPDAGELRTQLTSLVNSSPWLGWIEAAERP